MSVQLPPVIATIACSLASLSILASGVLIWSHLRIRKLRKYPGEFILMQCLLQFIIDCAWFLNTCELTGSDDFLEHISHWFFLWNIFSGSNYALVISFEIHSKIKKPFKSTSKLRRAFYHLLSLLTPSVYVFPFAFIGLGGGIIHIIYALMSLPIWVSLVLAVHSLHKLKRQNAANYMFYHLFVVFNSSAPLVLGVVLNFILILGHEVPVWLKIICLLVGCSSGTMVFVARVSEPKMFKQVLRSVVCRRDARSETLTEDSNIYESIISQEFNPYFSFFEGLQNTNVLKVLTGLNFLFSKRKPLEEYLIKQPNAAFWRLEVFLDTKIKYKVKEYFPEPFNILRTTEGISDFDLVASLSIRDNLQDLD